MNFDTLEKVWQKQIVTGNDEQTEAVVTRLKGEVATARRRIRGGIALVAFVLITGLTVTLVGHFTGIKRLTTVGLIAEAVYSVFIVLFFARAFHSARIVREENGMMGGTLHESIAATLRTVELQIQNARIAGFAIPVVIALSAWMFWAKYLAGEFPGFGVVAASVFMVVFGAAIGLIIWHRFRKHLAPRRDELKEMSAALDQNG